MIRNRNRMLFPERRRHFRIVTLRNFGWLTIAMLIAFAAITIQSEMRGRHPHDYGRLLDKQMPADGRRAEARRSTETVSEAAPATVESQPQPMSIVPVEPPPQTPVATEIVPQLGDPHVTIVGGPEGLTVVQQKRRRPLLTGGFGR